MKKQQNALSKTAILLRDTYQIYAKMLAVENIQVVFDEAIDAPAMFDILNRILYISPVHAAQAHLIPGLVIHEVGHALFSILTEAEVKKLKRITKLLNIIDDGYQERMMCKKYPNAKKHLLTVFDEFFLKTGDKAYTTPNKLINIVNILNYNCKGFKHGHYKQYPSYVLPEDLKLLQEAEMCSLPSLMERNEFQKVLAKALKKYGEMPDEGQDLEGKKGKGEKGDSGEDSEDGSDDAPLMDDDEENGDGKSGTGDSGEKDCKSKKKGSSGAANSDEDDIEDQLSKNEDKLNDHHKKFKQKMNGGPTYELPLGKDMNYFATIVDLYEKGGDVDKAMLSTQNLTLAEKFTRCLKEAKRVAGQIYTKFNMRVQASNYANTQYKKSGTLDPERAALYQVYDDVFQKTSVDPHHPNHAYVVMLDWSGSMGASVYPLALRIMELVYFAKAANVEIEVWLYTDNYGHKKGLTRNIATCSSKFIKVVNTKRINPVELDQRIKHFWLLAHEVGTGTAPKIVGAQTAVRKNDLKGTNILEGLIWGHHQLSLMEAEIKTCFILSDGSDTLSFGLLYNGKTGHGVGGLDPKIYVNGMDVDTMYKHEYTRENATAAVADLYLMGGQKTTGIAWNVSPAEMDYYCQSIVHCDVPWQSPVPEYVHADNMFVNEIVKNLL